MEIPKSNRIDHHVPVSVAVDFADTHWNDDEFKTSHWKPHILTAYERKFVNGEKDIILTAVFSINLSRFTEEDKQEIMEMLFPRIEKKT